MIKELKFCWGEPYCVREALKVYYTRKLQSFNIDMMGYTEDGGSDLLVKLTRDFIRATTGLDYKHIIITNGTTGAINVVLRTLKRLENKNTCYTHKYIFPYYKPMIEKNGYKHLTGLYKYHEAQLAQEGAVGVVDSPSNPEGDLLLYTDHKNNIIWDSVYHNPVFINEIAVNPDHRVNCGSYSKVLGLTGVRIGWIATNNTKDYQNFLTENLYENCTISAPSQDLIIDILNNIDLDNFLRSSKYRVNNNRELFDKVIYMFDGQAVPENGMFFVAWATPYTIKLFDKLGITYIIMDTNGKNKFLRFNLAQTNHITTQAVKMLLKEDKR